MIGLRRWSAVLAGAAMLLAGTAHAHGMRTAVLSLRETEPGVVLATWRTTVFDPSTRPRFSQGCTRSDAAAGAAADPRHHTFTLRCAGGLAGTVIDIDGLGPVLSEAVVRVRLADGQSTSTVLVPEHARWTVPRAEAAAPPQIALDYTAQGLWHIAGGLDHLLFLLSLVLLLRRVRAVFVAETAFTVSHTISFAATAMGWIHFPSRVAEACIALSLLLAAGAAWHGLVRGRGRRVGTAEGAALALIFGLVHGLGFAGALTELGIPDHAAAAALAGFALGIEGGQIAFLTLVLGAGALLRRTALIRPAQVLATLGIGCIGAYWLIDRALSL